MRHDRNQRRRSAIWYIWSLSLAPFRARDMAGDAPSRLNCRQGCRSNVSKHPEASYSARLGETVNNATSDLQVICSPHRRLWLVWELGRWEVTLKSNRRGVVMKDVMREEERVSSSWRIIEPK